jgi:hypothetical protein
VRYVYSRHDRFSEGRGTVETGHHRRKEEKTHNSWAVERWTPSLLIYSVLRSQGTCTGAGVDGPLDALGGAPFVPVYGVDDDGSESKYKSFGSSAGVFFGSGFNSSHS